MKLKLILILSIFISNSLSAMTEEIVDSPEVSFKQLENQDLQALLTLVSTQAIHDRDRIVVLPKLFREGALTEGIKKSAYFGAFIGERLVGYKKLFLMLNDKERLSTLQDEIRCLENRQLLLAEQHSLSDPTICALSEVFAYKDSSSIVIYDGADFTDPEYRKKHVNHRLTLSSLATLQEKLLAEIQKKQATKLLFVFGLTKDNEFRAVSINRIFIEFLNGLRATQALNVQDHVEHYAFKAFKPSFDEEALVCAPLGDDKAIEGAGHILVATLNHEGHDNA